MRCIRWLALSVSMALACGCSGSSEESEQPSGATCLNTQTLTYDNFGSAFFTSYCLSCHSSSKSGEARKDAPTDVNFDSLADIKMHSTQIDIEAAASPKRTNTSMPPGFDQSPPKGTYPSPDERMKLGEWLACGAP